MDAIEKQPMVKKLIDKFIENKNVQAYLLVGKDNISLNECSKIIAKSAICPYIYKVNCNDCNICKRIDNNSFSEFIEVFPENNVIKKEEIIKIKERFNKFSIEGKNMTYIIHNVDCLNISSGNSLLKFLEEPDSNSVAIFTTTNIDKVMETIVSRCQIINLNNEILRGLDFIKSYTNESDEEKITLYTNLLKKFEENPILFLKKLTKEDLLKEFKEKSNVIFFFNLLLLFNKDLLNYNMNQKINYFENVKFELYPQNNLVEKILLIMENINKLKYNVNINLLVSNFILEYGGLNESKGSRN